MVLLSTIRSSSLYTKQWYMSYRFADSLRAGSRWISVLMLLSSCNCNLYDIYHCCVYSEKLLMMDRGTVRKKLCPDPARKLSGKLYDIHHCCGYSEELLMNCPKHVEFYSKNKFEKLVHLVCFIIRFYHYAWSPERQKCPVCYGAIAFSSQS